MKKRIKILFFLLILAFIFVSCSLFREEQNSGSLNPGEQNKNVQGEEVEKTISDNDAFEAAEGYLNRMSLDEKIGQLFFVNLELLDTSKGSYYDFTKVTKKMKETMAEYPVGGIILMSKNIETKKQLKQFVADLQKSAGDIPLYIATEEAGGKRSIFAENTNLNGSILPGYAEMGKTKTQQEVKELAGIMGNELKELGFNLNLAPIADVGDMENSIAYAENCFSTDKDVTAKMVAGMVTGLSESGVGTVLRHFPGIGSVVGEIGQEFVNNEKGLMHMRENDFLPFRAGVEAGADMIQVSNSAVTKITQNTMPACMSEVIVEGIIREELGFDRVVITDVMNVPVITSTFTADKAALQALSAGVDMILMPEDLKASFQSVKQAILNQSLDSKIIDAAVIHILQSKIKRGILRPES